MLIISPLIPFQQVFGGSAYIMDGQDSYCRWYITTDNCFFQTGIQAFSKKLIAVSPVT